ncbi:MAG: cation diffusion facilitator family transporter [Eubacteriales bacterium]|jgi:cation diffusion facilitator family transporter
MKHTTDDTKTAMRVSAVTLSINIILSLLKFLAGIFARSAAMISDALHTASDVLSTFVVMIGVKLSAKEADREHPFGHERLECIAAIILAVMLFAAGAGIGYGGLNSIISGSYKEKGTPGILALLAAVLSIAVKEWMFWYTRAAAKKTRMTALHADAWHHRSDALSSIGALLGIGAARLGYPIFDPVASIIICLFILKVAVDIFCDAAGRMIDKAADSETEQKLREAVLGTEGVLGIDRFSTRVFGSRLYVEVEITADGDLPLCKSHDIAERVHENIESAFHEIKHCMVHVNPAR